MTALHRCATPEDRIDELEAEVRWLRDQLAIEEHGELLARLCRLYRLRVGAARMLAVLLKRRGRVCTNAFLDEWIVPQDSVSERRSNYQRVYVHQIRTMLGTAAVICEPGIGYRLSLGAVNRLEKALEAWPGAGGTRR